MIRLVKKQQIILKHREGVSNREIALQLGIDKNTVNKYVNQYEEELKKLLEANPDMDSSELTPGIIEKPTYNTENRSISDRAKAAIPIIRRCLRENARKRESGRSKQQMRKIEISDKLKKKGHQISYSTVRRLIETMEPSRHEAFIKNESGPGTKTEFEWV